MLVRKLPGHKIIISEDQLGMVRTMHREWLVEGRKIMHAGKSIPATPAWASVIPAQHRAWPNLPP